jgi:hypothetical protein
MHACMNEGYFATLRAKTFSHYQVVLNFSNSLRQRTYILEHYILILEPHVLFTWTNGGCMYSLMRGRSHAPCKRRNCDVMETSCSLPCEQPDQSYNGVSCNTCIDPDSLQAYFQCVRMRLSMISRITKAAWDSCYPPKPKVEPARIIRRVLTNHERE